MNHPNSSALNQQANDSSNTVTSDLNRHERSVEISYGDTPGNDFMEVTRGTVEGRSNQVYNFDLDLPGFTQVHNNEGQAVVPSTLKYTLGDLESHRGPGSNGPSVSQAPESHVLSQTMFPRNMMDPHCTGMVAAGDSLNTTTSSGGFQFSAGNPIVYNDPNLIWQGSRPSSNSSAFGSAPRLSRMASSGSHSLYHIYQDRAHSKSNMPASASNVSFFPEKPEETGEKRKNPPITKGLSTKAKRAPRGNPKAAHVVLELTEQLNKVYRHLLLMLISGRYIFGQNEPTNLEKDEEIFKLVENGSVDKLSYQSVHSFLDNKFFELGYRKAFSKAYIGGIDGINTSDQEEVMAAAGKYLTNQSYAHISVGELKQRKSLIPCLFNPQEMAIMMGSGWYVPSDSDTNRDDAMGGPVDNPGPSHHKSSGSDSTQLHFANPTIHEIGIEMLLMFPPAILFDIIAPVSGHRNPFIILSAALLMDVTFMNILSGVLTWHPTLDTQEDKAARARHCLVRAITFRNRMAYIMECDEKQTTYYILDLIFNTAIDRPQKYKNLPATVRSVSHDPYKSEGHIMKHLPGTEAEMDIVTLARASGGSS